MTFAEPWAMEPNRLAELATRLAGLTPADAAKWRAESPKGAPPIKAPFVLHGSTAEIKVSGVLCKEAPWYYDYLGIDYTETLALRSSIEKATADPRVSAIALRVSSPGGQVAGTLEAGDAIHEASKSKRVSAIVEDLAASGAYWLASQADDITATEDSMVGSIGVYYVLEDSSEAAAKAGYKVHVIRSGDHKGTGVPGSPVTSDQLKAEQGLIDGLAKIFKASVARGRELADEDVDQLATGQCWLANDSKAKGLIDQVEPAGAGFKRMLSEVDMDDAEQAKKAAEARNEAIASERQRTAELRAAFPGAEDSQFVLAQIESGATVEQANGAYVAILRERMAKAATVKPGTPAPVYTGGAAGAPALRSSGDPQVPASAGGSGIVARAQEMVEKSGGTLKFRDAMSRLAARDPGAPKDARCSAAYADYRKKVAGTIERGAAANMD